MMIVETIAKIRRLANVERMTIREISRELRLSRKVVRKALRPDVTAFTYKRKRQPRPQLDTHIGQLEALLAEELPKPKRQRLSYTRLFEMLRENGYAGGYDSVRRYAQRWFKERAVSAQGVFVPLAFAPGEAYQFDWSHETAIIDGTTTQIKVAHVRLCHSRFFLVRAYPRETQEMVFDAHEQAFRFFGGACRRGIYDNMRTAVATIFIGRQRIFNRRFEQFCSHHLVEPTACNPGAGWEKGQVENQVRTARNRFFKPPPRCGSLAELNEWLEARCLTWARTAAHPVQRDRTVMEVFTREDQPALVPLRLPFDGFHEVEAVASSTCLVRFDHNRYSVAARAAGRQVQLRAYAERIAIFLNGEIVAQHPRSFARHATVYDPWHYLPVLARKPGALRNGEPFRDWDLPDALRRIRQRLAVHPDGDRQFVTILSAVPEAGLEAVEAACTSALEARLNSADAVLNCLARARDPEPPAPILTPASLTLGLLPEADCARYDSLRAAVRA
ncbi:IS21 family transposase [Antarcticirhabdus aurantiaca]|uniref:IS21 family transposase n=1 Tax=Antarcticirhabdus aurantiaca TaxID=2606717 RepID=A0ACD4NY25_9HYPH|nr:IS21 family transposase [Antarcticirhabdus aurantiaca]WAJ31599.1 IS21 family transposase [Jeongeuplla avenae]